MGARLQTLFQDFCRSMQIDEAKLGLAKAIHKPFAVPTLERRAGEDGALVLLKIPRHTIMQCGEPG
jgi:hypothetical protein